MKQLPRRRAATRQSGHTLVELIVVTTLMAMITVLIAQAWRPIGHSTAELRQEATGLVELRIALAYLRQDLGGAERVRRIEGGALQLEREPEALARYGLGTPRRDPGVEYSLADGALVRKDRHTGESFAVAQLFGMEVVPTRSGARVQLDARHGKETRSLEVVWSR